MNVWDRSYAIKGYRYGVAPNAFLVEQAHRFPANASILVPGDGEGRNGVWLARHGHDVLSMDASRVGLEKARALAVSGGVAVRTLVADLATWAPEPQRADAVVLIHVSLPSGIRQSAHRRMATALRPGGVLVLECLHPRHLGYDSEDPMLYSIEMLREDFGGQLEELLAWEGETMLDEGSGHQGPAFITRWVGRAWSFGTTNEMRHHGRNRHTHYTPDRHG